MSIWKGINFDTCKHSDLLGENASFQISVRECTVPKKYVNSTSYLHSYVFCTKYIKQTYEKATPLYPNV